MLDQDGMPQTEEVEIKIPAFRAVSVFDVKQTSGEPIVDLWVNGEIDKAMFDLKKKELLEDKERLEKQLEGYQVDEDMSDEDYNRRLEVLKCGLENNFDFSVYDIPEEIIDDFVDEIIV